MRKSRFTEEQTVSTLKEAEAGTPAKELCRRHDVSPNTFYAWRSKYGGLEVSEARRLKQIDEEKRQLKQMVADLSLNHRALKAALGKQW